MVKGQTDVSQRGAPERRWCALAIRTGLAESPELRCCASGFAPAIIPQRSREQHGSRSPAGVRWGGEVRGGEVPEDSPGTRGTRLPTGEGDISRNVEMI